MPSATASRSPVDAVDAVRRFNRFYTRRIHVLDEAHLKSDLSLTAVRVMYELAHKDAMSAADLARELDLDAGYLSRILADLGRRQLVTRQRATDDARVSRIRLTARGRARYAVLDTRASDDIATLLEPLGDTSQHRLVAAMEAITSILDDGTTQDGARKAAPYLLRTHRPGDLGWMVWRHDVLYSDEYGWDERFTALVARVVSDFVTNYDPAHERCWIAERDGENVGSVMAVRHPERPGVAKLRLLLVEPSARGLGVGRRLVDECIRFSRQTGYHTLTLWTNSVLVAARRIYEAAGFQLVHEAPHDEFGHDLIGQTWEMSL
ncbi:MAG TPA: helix-turn-helix domain-containing GNAT family N-acetyltransferase [Gemmatimonadaceae bacterium]|nr:helix-turn-helix domain-containing GNAT family N-acetyltransferase [Gemmatimonadaceae bacterium]